MKPIELIREKSEKRIEAQIQSYRSLFAKSGTIIGVFSIFFPLFIFLITSSVLIIRILSIVPILLGLFGLLYLLSTLRSPSLARGVKVDKFEDLLNFKIEKLNRYEVSYNIRSFNMNKEPLKVMNKKYNKGLSFTIIAISISVTLLCLNIFLHNDVKGKSMNKVQTNIINYFDDNELPDVSDDDIELIEEGTVTEVNKSESQEENNKDSDN